MVLWFSIIGRDLRHEQPGRLSAHPAKPSVFASAAPCDRSKIRVVMNACERVNVAQVSPDGVIPEL